MTPTEAKEQVAGFVQTDPTKSPPPLPADWRALGATIGFDPRPANKLRFYLVGDHGSGKSTFVQSRPRNLVLSFEDSARFVPNPRSHRIDREKVPNYQSFSKVWDLIVADAAKPNRPFDSITFDTVDHLLDILNQGLVEKINPKDKNGDLIYPLRWDDITDYGTSKKGGKGWDMLYTELKNILNELSAIGYGWMCVSHLNEKTITKADGSDYTDIRISMPPGGARIVCREADFIINMDHKYTRATIESPPSVVTVAGKKVAKPAQVTYKSIETWVAEVASVRVKSTKRRVTMEDEIPLSKDNGYGDFAAAYERAVENERKRIAAP